MAEIRKHRPKTTAIGDLVRATVDSDAVRPNEPGSAQMPEDFDPFYSEESASPASAAAAYSVTSFGTDGWFALQPEALSTLSHPANSPNQDAAD